MSDHPPYEDDDLTAPPRLSDALRRSQPPVQVPSEIDDAVLRRARRHLQRAPAPVGSGPERSSVGPALVLDSEWFRIPQRVVPPPIDVDGERDAQLLDDLGKLVELKRRELGQRNSVPKERD